MKSGDGMVINLSISAGIWHHRRNALKIGKPAMIIIMASIISASAMK